MGSFVEEAKVMDGGTRFVVHGQVTTATVVCSAGPRTTIGLRLRRASESTYVLHPTHTLALVRSGVASGCIEDPISVFTRLVISALALSALAVMEPAASAEPVPTTTRKVVLEKAGSGYRWKRIEAPVPALATNQVLVHVLAVSLNRGDLEMLAPDAGRPGL